MRQKSYPGTHPEASVMCVCVTIVGAELYGLPIRTLPELVSLCGALMICKIQQQKHSSLKKTEVTTAQKSY